MALQILRKLALAASVCTFCLVLAGFVRGFLICDLISQFRLVYVLALIICTVVLALLRAPRLTLLSFFFFVITALNVVELFVPRPCKGEKQDIIRILNFNTEYQHNDNYALLDQLVIERNPEIIALVEVNDKWIKGIEKTTKPFPFTKIVIKGPGMALFSKYPIKTSEVKFYGRSHHPRIFVTILVKEKPVHLVLVHPTTPQGEKPYRERNAELALIGKEIESLPGAKILIGDLNCGPWSPEFCALLTHGLIDSQQGFGPQASWPARNGRIAENIPVPQIIPIDHVLVSTNICVLKRLVGPAMGSDHLPVFVELGIEKE